MFTSYCPATRLMLRLLLEILLQLLLVIPLLALTLRRENRSAVLGILAAFVIYFVLYNVLLVAPLEYPALAVLGGTFNWSGKVAAIFGSLSFLLLYRQFPLKAYYLTFSQNRSALRTGILLLLMVVAYRVFAAFMYDGTAAWNTEEVLFQATLPGLDEELAYRGIMLGLLVQALRPTMRVGRWNLGSPAVLVTALLFGLIHGFAITDSYALQFRTYAFCYTTLVGLLYGWVTVRSGSILLPLLTHNLANTLGSLIHMR